MATKKQTIDWLFPQVRKRVLSLLLMSPEERWYLRDIARRTGCENRDSHQWPLDKHSQPEGLQAESPGQRPGLSAVAYRQALYGRQKSLENSSCFALTGLVVETATMSQGVALG